FTWEMLKITGDGKYASEIEKSSYNALMAARAEDGLRWEYYVRTNGEMTPRGDWACCWSSGMTALEDVPVYMYDTRKDGIYVNIICESSYETAVRGKQVRLQQVSDYARTGVAEYVVGGQGSFTIAVHNPEWAASCKASVNGREVKAKVKDGYIAVKRSWKDGDRLTVAFPFEIRTLEKTWEYRNAGAKEHNFPNWYNGFTNHYVTFSAGPLVFATDHPDSFEKQDPLKLTRDEIGAARLVKVDGSSIMNPSPELHVGGLTLKPIAMMPPFEEGPQWRTTWFQIK
ncbi:MAG: glycoside hydrolase family 127 protein, partial [Bacteroidales bacterium]|nr:glycoside hydrolase family 127 protein [Bacteroidales bacterium]